MPEFPKKFLWGVSTSAYQIEGGVVNDWSQWEKSDKRKKELQKRGEKVDEYVCGQACDSYNRWQEDIDLVEKLNCNSYRFGLEWARVEPEKGSWQRGEIDHYRKILQELKKRNITTVLTLWHWTNPLWLKHKNGWQNREVVKDFSQYTEKMVEELGDLVDYWVTLNEPMVHVVNGYLIEKFPPNKKGLLKANKAFRNLALAHQEAYNIIHRKYPQAQVSITKLTNDFQPARKWCPLEKAIARAAHYFWNDRLMKKIENHLDYIGLDYYFHNRIVWHPPFRKNMNKKVNDMGWEIYPEGIYNVLKYLAKYQKPIIILENGLADSEDKHREMFIREHLEYIHKAIQEGVDVRGYFHWSLLDNFEWAEGFWPKFGLCEVDRKTFERRMRPSAKTYARICKNNRF